ncbi:hypothetical protein [Alkalicoccus chagannorensis]|uniref:hypothetical protein n=1 Tax=Alkalicoccus chagannorensis TaxID=427072 RepID=UPI0003FD4EAF|nr:hypothetical protein [Alkalicoccus chagannorensis]
MKKSLMTALGSMFLVGALAACGDMEEDEINNEPINDPVENETDDNIGGDDPDV